MDVPDEKLNRSLNLEFGGLDIRGSNIESFYRERLQRFLYSSAHKRPADMRKSRLPFKPSGRMGREQVSKPSESDLIREQLARAEKLLKKPLDPFVREKLSLWEEYLKEKRNAFPHLVRETYTAKSILMAYCYMKKTGIYPIPELRSTGLLAKKFYQRLSEKYSKSPNTFKNEWHAVNYSYVRLKHPEQIHAAIQILEKQYLNENGISRAVDTAKKELQAAEYKRLKKRNRD